MFGFGKKQNPLAPAPRTVRDLLVVDSDIATARLLVRIAETRSRSASTAKNVEEALNLCRRFNYRIILLEHYLLGGLGTDLIRRLQAEDLIKDSLLALLADGDAAARQTLYSAVPRKTILERPLTVTKFEALVKELN